MTTPTPSDPNPTATATATPARRLRFRLALALFVAWLGVLAVLAATSSRPPERPAPMAAASAR